MTDETPIHNASTVALLRSTVGGFEVFLSRRTSRAAFMANAYVYPGGRLDDADAEPRLLERDARSWVDAPPPFEDDVPTEQARALHVAAIRESFEEAGVLLARDLSGRPLDLRDGERARRFAAHRAALNAGALTLCDLLEREELVLDTQALHYFAHWITPPFESRRFDTRFFVAVTPDGQEAAPDLAELVAGEWLTPGQALDRYADQELLLSPPTLCTLQDLAACDSVEGVLRWAKSESPVPILPRLDVVDGATTLLLPGDPLYPSDRPTRGPWRLVLDGDRFVRR